ncbi:MAG: hypothetical protein HY723_03660 [Chloroflexi bacterium]|nr:hypothetical protein [Chloroflexota bacterium]
MARYRPLDLAAVRTQTVERRAHLVRAEDFASPARPGASFAEFVESLPRILKGNDLRAVVDALADAVREGKPVILGMGAHVIKCGLGPVVIDLVQRRAVSAIALNGGGAIHDFELAMLGATSEDVEAHLRDGRYGMVAETGRWMQEALEGAGGEGFGWALGRWLHEHGAPHGDMSVLLAAYEAQIPATVHVAIGTDTLHMLPGANGGLLGELSHRDFRLLAGVVSALQDGGVYVNAGSAVVLPEVFLKCVTLCRNLGYPVGGFTTVDLDMVRHYRPSTNVVARHAALGARGYSITGHHEIMLPLIAFALVERLAGAPAAIGAGARTEASGG